jgi:tight adherence protein B
MNMNSDLVFFFIGLVFFIVFSLSHILTIPSFDTHAIDKRQLKKRVFDIVQNSGFYGETVVKKKYLNNLGPIEHALEQLPGMSNLKSHLEQAGMNNLAYRFVLISLLISSLIATLIWLHFSDIFISAITLIFLFTLPLFWLKKKKANRFNQFEEQLPDALDIMSRALSTGYPFTESMKIIATEMNEPISHEFGLTYDEITYGRDFDAALALMIERIPSVSLIAMCTAIIIQRETGGNLSEVLLKISTVLRGRFKLRRRINTLSSEGLMSAWIMVLLPFVVFLAGNILNPDYFKLVYESENKMNFLYAFLGLEFTAAVWIRMVIAIDA